MSFFARIVFLIGDKSQAASRSCTVFINKHDIRSELTHKAIPAESNPEPATAVQTFASQVESQTTDPPSHPPFFYPGNRYSGKELSQREPSLK